MSPGREVVHYRELYKDFGAYMACCGKWKEIRKSRLATFSSSNALFRTTEFRMCSKPWLVGAEMTCPRQCQLSSLFPV